MIYEPSDQEVESVTSLSASNRYQYMLAKIADWEEIWSIEKESEWALMRDDAGNELVPVWPANKFALVCCSGMWKDYRPKDIPLTEWTSKWLPGIEKDRRAVAVFPLQNNRGTVVLAQVMQDDISKALQQYG